MTDQKKEPTKKVNVPGSFRFSDHGSQDVCAFPHDALREIMSCCIVFRHLHPHSRWDLLCPSWHCFFCEPFFFTRIGQSSEGFEWDDTHPFAYLDRAIVFKAEKLARVVIETQHAIFPRHLGTAFFSPRKILTASMYLLRMMCSAHPSPEGLLLASSPPDSLLRVKPSFAACHSVMLTPTAEAQIFGSNKRHLS